MNPVALEISSNSIRILRLKNNKLGLLPKIYHEEKFERRINIDNLESDAREKSIVINTLKKIKKIYNLKYVISALPEDKIYIYQTEFPRQALDDVASAVKLNIEENVPLTSKEVNFSYKVSDSDEDKIIVTVNVVPKKVIEKFTNLIESADLIPFGFLAESEVISKAVVPCDDQGPNLIVRMNQDNVNILITKSNIVHYANRIPLNFPDLKLGVESEEFKKLSQELNKTLIYWFTNKNTTSENQKIEKAVLVGKLAKTPDLVEYLENSLKIDVEIGNNWINCFSFEDYIPKIKAEEALDMSVVIGLSLYLNREHSIC